VAPGYYCRILADYSVKVNIYLRPTDFVVPESLVRADVSDEISTEFITNPAAERDLVIKRISRDEDRPFAVCTVQTFRNGQSGNGMVCLETFDSFY